MSNVVTLDYNRLVAGEDLSDQIGVAFGVDGLGILTVANVPTWEEKRRELLPIAREFADLPEEVKAKYEHPQSYYSFGWSHGKEKLDGVPDKAKGSYYANPQYDRPIDDEALIAQHAPFIHPNIWPTEDCPTMESAFKALGQLIVSVGELVARQCDLYVKKHSPTYTASLENTVKTSRCCKARLLHYFPLSEEEAKHMQEANQSHDPFSSWCGWHNDHGSLTGLASAMYLDEHRNEIKNPDPESGLYIRNRRSELVKVAIPQNHIAFQIGETAQIHSGGLLQATPHAVRGSAVPNISRETFAVFMEPMWDCPMHCPEGVDPNAAQSQSAAANLPRGVPPLASRWKPDMDFGQFTDATLKSYY